MFQYDNNRRRKMQAEKCLPNSAITIFPKQRLRLRYAYSLTAAIQKILRLVAAESVQENFASEVSCDKFFLDFE